MCQLDWPSSDHSLRHLAMAAEGVETVNGRTIAVPSEYNVIILVTN